MIGERLGLTEGPVVGFKELVQLGQGLHNVQLLSVDLVGVVLCEGHIVGFQQFVQLLQHLHGSQLLCFWFGVVFFC